MYYKEKKEVQRSIRMTKKVYDIVDALEGDSFNEKFEKAVLEYEKKKASYESDLRYYEYRLGIQVDALKTALNDLEQLEPLVKAALDVNRLVLLYRVKIDQYEQLVNGGESDIKTVLGKLGRDADGYFCRNCGAKFE